MIRSAQEEPMSQIPTQMPQAGDGVRCLSCGYSIVGVRIGERCPECGSVINQFGAVPTQSSGRAIASMVLGIISIITCFAYGLIGMPCGILAVIFAKKARLAVQAGTAPASSLGMANAGRVCGWVGIALNSIGLIVFFIYIAVFIVALTAGATGAAGGFGGGPMPAPAPAPVGP
jgi:DNA-directed RNA polymerase subunit RPC12/RpoP